MRTQNESLDDFLAKQTLEGKRISWIANQKKIVYVLQKTKKYLLGISTCCDIGTDEIGAIPYWYD